MHKLVYASLLCIPFALAGACATPADSSASQSLSSVEAFCNARSQAECNAQVVKQCGAKDTMSCATARETGCLSSVPQGTTYEPERAQSCVAAVRDAYGDATLTKAKLDLVASSCALVFSGPGAVRSPCATNYDCSSKDGLACMIPVDGTMGRCLKPNVVPDGAACPNEADTCSKGYFCDPKAKVCEARAAEGVQCIPGQVLCAEGLLCPGGLFNSVCRVKLEAGHSCTLDDDCADGMCDKANGQAMGTCAVSIKLSQIDSACAAYR